MSNGASAGTAQGSSAGASADKATLDEVLVALQKSFSRVSAASRDVPSENARAIITGSVKFELGARFEIRKGPQAGPDDSPDVLVHRDDGALDLRLMGQVETDTRIRDVSKEPQ
jgi:hypothetical protein